MSRARSQEKNVTIPHLQKQTRAGGIHVINPQIEDLIRKCTSKTKSTSA